MTIREKKDEILLGLYKRMKAGELKGKLCALHSVLDIDRAESREIGINLKNDGLVSGQVVSSGFAAILTLKGQEYVENILEERTQSQDKGSQETEKKKRGLPMKDKYRIVLTTLYDLNSGYHEIDSLLSPHEEINLDEATDLGHGLENKGYIKLSVSKSNAAAYLTAAGREYVEEELLKTYEYHSEDLYTEREKIEIIDKLDLLLSRIQRLEMGQEIIHNSFEKEFYDLKAMLNFMNKKDWRQMLLGKLVDAGLGAVAPDTYNAISEVFKESKLLG